jgi:glycerophosphoryl diester phosphodiesterase
VVTVYAHRGASAAEPENTLAAFRRAVAMGADGVELDVRRSADGAPVVHHDAHLTDGRAIVDLPAADLPGDVPLLDAALDACRGVAVNVEIKNLRRDPDYDPDDSLVSPVLAACRGHDVLISSFNLVTIDRVLAAGDGVPTAFLAEVRPDREVAGRLVERCHRHGHRVLHPHHAGVTEHLVGLCRDRGIAINTWTVDDPERMTALASLGVDGIITNVPDVALRTLR